MKIKSAILIFSLIALPRVSMAINVFCTSATNDAYDESKPAVAVTGVSCYCSDLEETIHADHNGVAEISALIRGRQGDVIKTYTFADHTSFTSPAYQQMPWAKCQEKATSYECTSIEAYGNADEAAEASKCRN